jgi:hypothetical protein
MWAISLMGFIIGILTYLPISFVPGKCSTIIILGGACGAGIMSYCHYRKFEILGSMVIYNVFMTGSILLCVYYNIFENRNPVMVFLSILLSIIGMSISYMFGWKRSMPI